MLPKLGAGESLHIRGHEGLELRMFETAADGVPQPQC